MVTGYCFMTLDICVANSDSDLYHKSAARYYIKTAKTPGKKNRMVCFYKIFGYRKQLQYHILLIEVP